MVIDCRHILTVLGSPRVAAELGVTEKSTNRAANLNVFPASWYFVLRAMCAEAGINCPLQLFSFKTSDHFNHETGGGGVTGQARSDHLCKGDAA